MDEFSLRANPVRRCNSGAGMSFASAAHTIGKLLKFGRRAGELALGYVGHSHL
jgi:hypothetical protein